MSKNKKLGTILIATSSALVISAGLIYLGFNSGDEDVIPVDATYGEEITYGGDEPFGVTDGEEQINFEFPEEGEISFNGVPLEVDENGNIIGEGEPTNADGESTDEDVIIDDDGNEVSSRNQSWFALTDASPLNIAQGSSSASKSSTMYASLIKKMHADKKEEQQLAEPQPVEPSNTGDYNPSSITSPSVPGIDMNEIINNANANNQNNGSTNGNSDGVNDNTTAGGVPIIPVDGYPNGDGATPEIEDEFNLGASTTGVASDKPVDAVKEDKVNIYDFVPDETKLVKGKNKLSKIFDEFNSLTETFVIELGAEETIDKYLSDILLNYKGQLLIDSLKYNKVTKDSSLYYKLEVRYLISKDESTQLKAWGKKMTERAINLNETEKVKFVNKEIKALAEYSEKASKIYSPYSLYKNGKGVCQAYTSLAKFAFDAMGIQNTIATGYLDGTPHTWNVVNIDGKEYHVDITNNDSLGEDKYLLVDESEIDKFLSIDKVIR